MVALGSEMTAVPLSLGLQRKFSLSYTVILALTHLDYSFPSSGTSLSQADTGTLLPFDTMSTPTAGDTVSSLVAKHQASLSRVSLKAVGSQVALMSAISASISCLLLYPMLITTPGLHRTDLFILPAEGEESVCTKGWSMRVGQQADEAR
jgi:hypothetical protein